MHDFWLTTKAVSDPLVQHLYTACPLCPTAQVITNGYLSFGQSYISFIPGIFPQGSGTNFLVAPFFADIDIGVTGTIRYEVHTSTSSSGFLADVSNFIRSETGSQFTGQWMLLAEWYNVPPFGGPYDEVRHSSSKLANYFHDSTEKYI